MNAITCLPARGFPLRSKSQRSIQLLFLVATLASANAFSASVFGERTKSAPRAAAPIAGKLVISGPSTMAPMIARIAKRFEALHPGTQIEIHDVRSVGGISDVRDGSASIGMLTRALSDTESDLTSYPVARDGVCVIVHKANRVTGLTSQQVGDIYSGKIVNWDKLGGAHAAIVAISGDANSSAKDVFVRYFKIKYDEIKPGVILRSSVDRIKAVAENQTAISYASIGEVQRNIKAGLPIRALPAEGVSPTAKSLRSGNFPIARPVTLITKGTENELTKEFIRYALSPNVFGIIEMSDFVPYQD